MADHYAREAARLAALQLADSAGFDVVQQTCVDILSDLLLRYINEAGAASHHYAELAGRSETNPVDVTLALNDMGTTIGQLKDFVRHVPEVPFEATITAFPLRKKSRPPPTFQDCGEQPPPHIPAWLPALPDKHTYQATPVYPGHEQDAQKRQMLLTEQRQQAETALVRLQARLAAESNQLLAAKLPKEEEEGAAEAGEQQEGGGAPGAAGGGANGRGGAADSNPFLAGPWGEPEAQQQQQQERPKQYQQQQQQQQQEAARVAAAVEAALKAVPSAAAGGAVGAGGEQAAAGTSKPTVEWEQLAWEAAGGAATAGRGGFVQQLFASSLNWKAQQQRNSRIATSGRAVREAFGEAYDESAGQRAGKRQKRAGGVAAAAANDPTRARVEGILAASSQPVLAPAAAGQEDVMQEQI